MLDDLDALADEHERQTEKATKLGQNYGTTGTLSAAINTKKHVGPRTVVGPNYNKPSFDWQISIGYPLVLYCKVCFWGSSNDKYESCPYSHGVMAPIADYYAELLDDV